MKYLVFILMLCVCVFPKINIISVGSSFAGIRAEDFLVLVCIVLLLCSYRGKLAEKSNKEFKHIRKLFYTYFLFATVSTAIGIFLGYVSPLLSVLFLFRKLEYFLLIYIGFSASIYIYPKRLTYVKGLVLIHFLFSLLQYFGLMGSFNKGEALSVLTQGRVSSTFNGAYELSAFLLLLLPLFLTEIFIKKNKVIKNYIYVILITLCILLSQSRTSLLVEGVIVLIVLIKSKFLQSRSGFVKVCIPIVLVLLPSIYLFSDSLDLSRYSNLNAEGILYLFKYTWENKNFEHYVQSKNWYGNASMTINQMSDSGYDASLYARLSHWMQLIDGWTKHPIFGVGVSISGNSADGNYVKILVETGIVGLFTWCNLIKKICTFLRKSKSYLYFSTLSIVFGAILIDLFDASKVMMLFWFMIGVFIKDNGTKFLSSVTPGGKNEY